MTFEIDNEKIGGYIANLIKQYYSSDRDFCRQYLKRRNIESNNDEVSKMANRLSQIKRGRKSIQIVDLPIFAELLHVSCEEILAGGSQLEKDTSRLTNFTIAQSHDKDKWEEYVNDDRQPILYADEYGKTVLEYAIEFENYDFIKFLVDKGYIWFDSGNAKDYVMTFGAGTSIQQIKFVEISDGMFIRKLDIKDLPDKLCEEDRLRMNIISLAISNDDPGMLKELRAREIPELYYKTSLMPTNHDVPNHDKAGLVQSIAKSNDKKVIAYFTEPFEIIGGKGYQHTFVFPYLSELLDAMIVNHNPHLKEALERAVKHNESTAKKLMDLIGETKSCDCYCERYPERMMIYRSGDFIHFIKTACTQTFVTNITKITADYKGNDRESMFLIERLQNSYQNIMSMPMLKHLE
ncbi:MAG: hypothetical protein DBX41_04375 [Clostridiales bacterium]|nr:MAG: hypothetical protein DBX41_04375 [Clostridiales bacterium]